MLTGRAATVPRSARTIVAVSSKPTTDAAPPKLPLIAMQVIIIIIDEDSTASMAFARGAHQGWKYTWHAWKSNKSNVIAIT